GRLTIPREGATARREKPPRRQTVVRCLLSGGVCRRVRAEVLYHYSSEDVRPVPREEVLRAVLDAQPGATAGARRAQSGVGGGLCRGRETARQLGHGQGLERGNAVRARE